MIHCRNSDSPDDITVRSLPTLPDGSYPLLPLGGGARSAAHLASCELQSALSSPAGAAALEAGGGGSPHSGGAPPHVQENPSTPRAARSRSAVLASSAVDEALDGGGGGSPPARGGAAASLMPPLPKRTLWPGRAAGRGTGRDAATTVRRARSAARSGAVVDAGGGGESPADLPETALAQAAALGVSPKRMKRILANRRSAAAAKARKAEYHKVIGVCRRVPLL